MRTVAATIALTILVSACSGSNDSSSSASAREQTAALNAQGDKDELQVSLSECGDGQNAVAKALNDTDKAAAINAIHVTQAACRVAARDLRHVTTPSTMTDKGAAAIDQMVDGLGKVADAIAMDDSSIRRAKVVARQGMLLYIAGLKDLTEARASQ